MQNKIFTETDQRRFVIEKMRKFFKTWLMRFFSENLRILASSADLQALI